MARRMRTSAVANEKVRDRVSMTGQLLSLAFFDGQEYLHGREPRRGIVDSIFYLVVGGFLLFLSI